MIKTYKMMLLISLTALLITGCTHTENPLSDINKFCANAFPVYLSKNEYLNDVNADKIMSMDKYGIEHCGWKF